MFRTLRSRVILTYFLVVLISLLLASVVFVFFLNRYQSDRDKDELGRQTGEVAKHIANINTLFVTGPPQPDPALEEDRRQQVVRQTLSSESHVMGAELVLLAEDGRIVAGSGPRLLVGRELDIKPELLNSAGTQVGESVLQVNRGGEFVDENFFVATAPTTLTGGELGFILAVKPVGEIGTITSSLIWYLVLAGLIALALSMLLALYLSGAVSRPVRAVTEAARSMAAGDYEQEVVEKGPAETRELAQDFNLMAEQVRTAYERQLNFAGNVSHELRTPLTSIEGFSQALLDGVSSSEEERRRSLQIINQESKRLVRVLRDVLLLSQIDAGELSPEKNSVDLADMLLRMQNIYTPRSDEARVSLEVKVPSRPIAVSTGEDRLERVLTNLLDNAVKYAGDGGTVTLTADTAGNTARISVSDDGPGIDDNFLPHVFERFYRADGASAHQESGAGLGLAICKELVESLGGSIGVESRPGRGSTFTVNIPL